MNIAMIIYLLFYDKLIREENKKPLQVEVKVKKKTNLI